MAISWRLFSEKYRQVGGERERGERKEERRRGFIPVYSEAILRKKKEKKEGERGGSLKVESARFI